MLARLRSLCRAWRHRATVEQDTHDELRFHVESRADDLVRRGLAPEQAARQARLEFGNPSGYQDQCRDARGLRLADDFAADVRFALRGFRRHKALSAIVVVTLTFGIGV
ncbi:MAG TPA: permease prefix domain 1-containing protein, partial [Vicinamibacterales bacterium]|nr:permease prefix domain 1-containing protein [Vicinamibacterales bacterium]